MQYPLKIEKNKGKQFSNDIQPILSILSLSVGSFLSYIFDICLFFPFRENCKISLSIKFSCHAHFS